LFAVPIKNAGDNSERNQRDHCGVGETIVCIHFLPA
jgi:hypothetical protein